MTLTTVYAVNISKNRPVTALYSEEGRPASLVVDGSDPGDGENKYWQSGSMLDGQLNHRNEPQWLTVDLKAREMTLDCCHTACHLDVCKPTMNLEFQLQWLQGHSTSTPSHLSIKKSSRLLERIQ